MTPENPPMTLREMDSRIAEKLFGWVWLTRSVYSTCWLAPSLESEVARLADTYGGTVREFDAEVDGYKERESIDCGNHAPRPCDCNVVPRYTTDPIASKQVREKLAEKWDWIFGCGKTRSSEPPFGFALYSKNFGLDREPVYAAEAQTEELCVALCALRSVGIDLQEKDIQK